MKSRELLPIVAAALVREDGRILVQQRPPGRSLAGLWEFPGGKLESGETPEEALARELAEELGVDVAPTELKPAGFASEALGDRHLVLLLYVTSLWQGDPRPLHAAAIRWADLEALRMLPMPSADLPLVDALERLLAFPRARP